MLNSAPIPCVTEFASSSFFEKTCVAANRIQSFQVKRDSIK